MDLSNENIIHIKKDTIEYLQFRKLLEYSDIITHAYSLKKYNENYKTTKYYQKTDSYETAIQCYKTLCSEIGTDYKNLVKPCQKHTDHIASIKEKVKKEEPDFMLESLKNTDGTITNQKNLLLSSTNADCILLLFFDPVKKVIANIHSGWKGTLQRIGVKAVEKLVEEYHCNPADIICCICPSIRECHFEVQEDVKKLFENEFKDLENIIINRNGQYYIDTVEINKIILKRAGLKQANIIDSKICSICNQDLIHSYRVEGSSYGLNTALIGLV